MYNKIIKINNSVFFELRLEIIIFLLLFNSAFLIGQNTGIAVEESPFSAKVNPALMAAGNSAGIAWTGEIDTDGLTNTCSFIISGGYLAYYYDNEAGEKSHNFALSFPSGQGISTGTSIFFPSDSDENISWNLSMLVRPVRFLSLGIRTMDIASDDPYLVYGTGLRPFFFSPYWISRLTLFTDLKYQDKNNFSSSGIRLEPFDGLNIYTNYLHDDKIIEAGLIFSLNHLTAGFAGISDKDYKMKKGRIISYIPFKKERSVLNSPMSFIAEYDMANIIRDYPSSNTFPIKLPGLSNQYSKSLYDFINDMEKIAETDEIKAVIFKNQHFITSYANITEISDVLIRLKNKGKKIYFYFDNAGNNAYTLAASSADEIFLNPSGSINLRGYSKRSLYMKDFFSKFGVEFYNFRSHEYKTAYNNFTETQMTEAEHEILDKLYTAFREKQVSLIEKGRSGRINADAARLIASGPYLSAGEAEKSGLIDRRIYKDELEGFYKEKSYIPVKYSFLPDRKDYEWKSLNSKILPVIYASGDIVPGSGIKGKMIGSDSFAAAVRAAKNNPNIKCIIIRINSGGGSAFASDVIARAVAQCRTGDNPKPVIISMGGAAASGGYYMAAPADIIFTDEVTVTGSIGVIALFPDLSGLLTKLGIQYESVNSSDSSDFGNPLRSLNKNEIEKIKNYIAENYDQFLDIVKKYRKLNNTEADYAAQGKVWAGKDAVELKLADRIGGLDDALNYAVEKYYKGNEYRITETVPGNSLFNFPFPLGSAKEKSNDKSILLSREIEEVLEFYTRLEQFEAGEALYFLPYTDKETGILE